MNENIFDSSLSGVLYSAPHLPLLLLYKRLELIATTTTYDQFCWGGTEWGSGNYADDDDGPGKINDCY